jgi:hypothetical protein
MTPEAKERLRRAGQKAQQPAMFMTYVEGCFRMQGADMTNTDWIAAPDLGGTRWTLYRNGSAEPEPLVLFTDDPDPPRPDNYTDKEKWEIDPKNPQKRKDPYGRAIELPLIDTQDGAVVIFKATTVLGRAAVGPLLEDIAKTARRPFVTLIVEPNAKNVNQMVPEFRITGYSDHDVDLPGLETAPSSPKNAATTNGAGPSDGNGARSSMRTSDMDDDIPFNPEFR